VTVSKLLKFQKFLIILNLLKLELFLLNVFQIIHIHIYLIYRSTSHLTQNILLVVDLLVILSVLIIIQIWKALLKTGLTLAVTAGIRESIHILKVKRILLLLAFLVTKLFINLELVKLLILKMLLIRLFIGRAEYSSVFKLLLLLVVFKLPTILLFIRFWLIIFVKTWSFNHPILNILIIFYPKFILLILKHFILLIDASLTLLILRQIIFLVWKWLNVLIELIHLLNVLS
jgi:hypothetical protein